MCATVIHNGKRERIKALRVYEEGRRVHGWQLQHDLLVNCLENFRLYWVLALRTVRAPLEVP